MLSVDGLQSTVCSQQWDNTDARIYCRTLGYNFGRAFGTTYQYTLVPRIVSNVSCSGNEASITDCPFSTASAAYCRGSRNAKVFCYNSQQGGLNVEAAVNKKWGCTPGGVLYLVFTRMPGESYRMQLRSLLLYLCYVFWALISSLVCWSCRVI